MDDEIEMEAEDDLGRGWVDMPNENIHTPIVVMFARDGSVELWDGWHRTASQIVRGADTIPAIVGVERAINPLTESQEEINGTVYLKSPSLGVLKAYVQRDWAKNLRGLLAPNLKDVYVWKGEQKLHDEAMKDLGLDYRSVGLSYWNFRFDIQFNDTDNAYYFRVGADNHYVFADNRYIRSITDIDEETPGVAIRLK